MTLKGVSGILLGQPFLELPSLACLRITHPQDTLNYQHLACIGIFGRSISYESYSRVCQWIFYQFNTLGNAQVRQCASNQFHTYPTESLQNLVGATSKGKMMDRKQNVNVAPWDPLPDHQGGAISSYQKMSPPFSCIFSIITMLWKKDG